MMINQYDGNTQNLIQQNHERHQQTIKTNGMVMMPSSFDPELIIPDERSRESLINLIKSLISMMKEAESYGHPYSHSTTILDFLAPSIERQLRYDAQVKK